MKKYTYFFTALITLTLVGANISTNAQPGATRTTSKITYHNGPVLTGAHNIYLIFYGCWGTVGCGAGGDTATMDLLQNFSIDVGDSPYIQINMTYPDGDGQVPTGQLVYGGYLIDRSYSRGVELTRTDVVDLINEKVNAFQLPHDPQGLYFVVPSADVGASEMGFCTQGARPYHGVGIVNGVPTLYGLLGNPARCPLVAGATLYAKSYVASTPNDTFSGDAMVGNLAHLLNGMISNPMGNGWYDRAGLEAPDKCAGTVGTIYLTSNGSWANVRLGGRDYVLEQNWVNAKKGRCALLR